MPRSRRAPASAVSLQLFPFLSVIACTIGSIVLIIVVISTQLTEAEGDETQAANLISTDPTVFNKPFRPGDSRSTPNLRFVECRQSEAIVYPPGQLIVENEDDIGTRPTYAEDGSIAYPSAFDLDAEYLDGIGTPTDQFQSDGTSVQRLLSEVSDNPNFVVAIAVRPEGIATFERLRALLEEQGIEYTFEPLPRELFLAIVPAN